MKLRENKKSYMNVFFKDDNARPLILIMPGGGYDHTSLREGEPIAKYLNEHGYHAAVIYYREELYPYPEVTLDMASGVKILLNDKRVNEIITMGFSAGAHAVALYNCQYEDENLLKEYYSNIKIRRTILCYPVVLSEGEFAHKSSFEYLKATTDVSIDHLITNRFPKAFIWHTVTDESVNVMNSLKLMEALSLNNINYEAHLYPIGPHAMSLAIPQTAAKPEQSNAYVSDWGNQLLRWLEFTR